MIEIERLGVPAFTVAVLPDNTFRYLATNAIAAELSGMSTAGVAGRTPYDLHERTIADRLCEQYRTCATQRRVVEYDTQTELPVGRTSWRTSLMPVIGASGDVEVLVGVCHDMIHNKPVDQEIKAANLQLDLAIRCLKGAHWRFDVQQARFEASSNFALLMGEDRPRPVAWSEWADRILAEDATEASCDALLGGGRGESVVRFRFRDKQNRTRWAQCRRIVETEAGGASLICGVVVDVTDEQKREMDLKSKAHTDSLTGLWNRRGLKQECDSLLARRGARAGEVAVCVLDLDGFKLINDRLGHAAGDDVLIEVGRRLVATVGNGAVVARLGGDEFAVVATGLALADAEALRARIAEALCRPHHFEGAWIPMAGSVGLSWRFAQADLQAMMAEADDRLYREKRARRARQEHADDAEAPAGQLSLFAA